MAAAMGSFEMSARLARLPRPDKIYEIIVAAAADPLPAQAQRSASSAQGGFSNERNIDVHILSMEASQIYHVSFSGVAASGTAFARSGRCDPVSEPRLDS
eukprot:8609208-Pyramimonas_sp.AAC.1